VRLRCRSLYLCLQMDPLWNTVCRGYPRPRRLTIFASELNNFNVRKSTMKPISGSCLCGKVAFVVTGIPIRFIYCHCRSCQKSSGSVHAANLVFPESSVTWKPVPKLSRNRQLWNVPSGLLDSDPGMRPQANIYWVEHAPWYVSADQIAKNDGKLVEQRDGGND
jgi:hypothetical protein